MSGKRDDPGAGPSPGSYAPPRPSARQGRKAWNIIIGVTVILALILMYSIMTAGSRKDEEGRPEIQVEGRRLMPGKDEGRGLLARTPEDGNGIASPPEPNPRPLAPVPEEIRVVGPAPADLEAEARKREELEDRRRRREAERAALSSGILAGASSRGGQAPAPREDAPEGREAREAGGAPGGPDGYDPAADVDKEGFFRRNETAGWMSPHAREPGHPYEVKTGSVIPGVMVTGIVSDLPGNLVAQVSQNVFDTATGRFLLIPQGTRLYGVYDSRVVHGQERVLVAWNRLIFPDGSSVTLGAMPGADMGGLAGFRDSVDNHYPRIFGSAILMSLITGGVAYAMDGANGQETPAGGTSMRDEMTSALGAQLGQTTLRLLEKNLSVKPTLGVRPGYRFNVMTTKDVVFRAPYPGLDSLAGPDADGPAVAAAARGQDR
ncbi:MAG: conjugal transfer protein TrbI [Deltaproteobacteria bacterium]|jgi:type IV secretion system protein VirB10|nr:conjugal transfer protein TrbI [Deltaproteobacteria bacterium]